MEFDEEARDDVNDGGPLADAGELPGDEYVDLNDVSPQDLADLDESGEMTGPQDAIADAEAESELAEPAGVSDAAQPADASESDFPAAESAALSAEERALQQERIDHPMRFSPSTGERARPGHVYMPWKPPAQSYPMPAVSGEDAPTGESESSGPKAIPLPFRPRQATAEPGVNRPAAGKDRSLPPREDIGQPLPPVLVTVSLANAQALFDDALKQASQHMAKQFRELAIGEIDFAAFKRRAEERAADYSLRGPVF